MSLTLEEPFGTLVRLLREQANCTLQELPNQVLTDIGVSISWRGVQNIENGKSRRPHQETVKALCRFFYRQRQLESQEDVAYFCVRAGYRVQRLQLEPGHDIAALVLSPLQGTSFSDLVQLVLESAQTATSDERARTVVDAFGDGLRTFMRSLSTFVPAPTDAVVKLEEEVERLLLRDTLQEAELARIAVDLERRFDQEKDRVNAFRLAYLLARVEQHRGNYANALTAADRAYYLAHAAAVGREVNFDEPLARLCETLGEACLNVGTREYWTRAEALFREAIDHRESLKSTLRIQIDLAEEHTVESLLQLARSRTWHGRHVEGRTALQEGEAQYLRLLELPALQSRPVLRAHAQKELADNYRFTGDESKARDYFDAALESYRSLPARILLDDPTIAIEAVLNIAYCLRRLDREAEAYEEFLRALHLAHRRRDRRRVAYSSLQVARSPLLDSRADERAFYAAIAWRIMQGEGALADADQAKLLLDAAGENLTAGNVADVANDVAASDFAIYFGRS